MTLLVEKLGDTFFPSASVYIPGEKKSAGPSIHRFAHSTHSREGRSSLPDIILQKPKLPRPSTRYDDIDGFSQRHHSRER